ncbi:MAG: ParA family protein [Desulfobacteraceae bacterium]
MCTILTIAGQEGGSGKTAIAVNLAASLALLEKKTLIVDCDPRGCATSAVLENQKTQCDLSSVFSGKAALTEAVINADPAFLYVLPANFNLFYAATRLSCTPGNEKILRNLLDEIKGQYDYIIIDPPSSFSFLTTTAMAASNWLLIPFSGNYSSFTEFKTLLKMVRYIDRQFNIHLKISGLVLNRCSVRQKENFNTCREFKNIRDIVYNTCIPWDNMISSCAESGRPAALCDLDCPGAKACLSLAREVCLFFR